MEEIYTRATTGIIWLGETDPLIDLALPMIEELTDKFRGYDSRLGFDRLSLAAQGLPIPSSPIWAGIESLFCKDWFTRVWTFQGAILPQRLIVLYGKQLIKLSALFSLAISMLAAAESGSVDSITDPRDFKIQRATNSMRRLVVVVKIQIPPKSESRRAISLLKHAFRPISVAVLWPIG
jgi:hypothetical protein